jgi:hypothetical protein
MQKKSPQNARRLSKLADIMSQRASDDRANRHHRCGFRPLRHRDCYHRPHHGFRRPLNCGSERSRNATERNSCDWAQSNYGLARNRSVTELNKSETEPSNCAELSNCGAGSIHGLYNRWSCAAAENRSVDWSSSLRRSDCCCRSHLAPKKDDLRCHCYGSRNRSLPERGHDPWCCPEPTSCACRRRRDCCWRLAGSIAACPGLVLAGEKTCWRCRERPAKKTGDCYWQRPRFEQRGPSPGDRF